MSLFVFRPTISSFNPRKNGYNVADDKVVIAGQAYFNNRKSNTNAKEIEFQKPKVSNTPYKFSAVPRETMYTQFAKAFFDEKNLREYRERLDENINDRGNNVSKAVIKKLIPEFNKPTNITTPQSARSPVDTGVGTSIGVGDVREQMERKMGGTFFSDTMMILDEPAIPSSSKKGKKKKV